MNLPSYVAVSSLLLMLLICPNIMAQNVYKWVDENGVTHYNTRPPQGDQQNKASVTNIKTQTKLPKDATAAQERLDKAKDSEAQSKEAQLKAEEKSARNEQENRAAEQLKENCKNSKLNIDTLKTNPRVREKDENGEFRYLTPEEHTSRMNKAKQFVSEHCQE